MRVAVTGANGFVGKPMLEKLVRDGFESIALVRQLPERRVLGAEYIEVGDLVDAGGLSDALSGADVVIHAAARVHIMNDVADDPYEEFRKVNVQATEKLARESAKSGVRRFIYLSSVKVNGELSAPGKPFSAEDCSTPLDPYGRSKLEAEQKLLEISKATGMEVVIIRPVLVYGPGVKANFRSMMYWLSKGLPLPLGAINNCRSLVAIDNLVDLIMVCLTHPAAAGKVFMASDNEDLSTPDLLRKLGGALGRRPLLIPVPESLIRAAAALLGRREMVQRLCGDLQVDVSRTMRELDWVPPVRVEQAFRKTAQAYLSERANGD